MTKSAPPARWLNGQGGASGKGEIQNSLLFSCHNIAISLYPLWLRTLTTLTTYTSYTTITSLYIFRGYC